MATTNHPPSPENPGNASPNAEQYVPERTPASVSTEKPPSGNLAATSEKTFVPEPLPTIRLVPLILGVCLGLFLSMLDSSIVATSLFTIAAEFGRDGIDVSGINWVALAYTLSYLGCAVLFARVSDVIGRRATFAAAYVVFIAFSVGCGFATNLEELIALRALQGMGGSGLYSVAMVILTEATPERAKQHIAGVIGFVVTISGVLGPVLGGILTEFTSWRWVFWINGPVGVFSLIVFILSWPDNKYLPSLERRAWKDLDFVSAFLFVRSVGAAGGSDAAPDAATAQGIIAQVRIFGGSIGIAASSAILAVKLRADLAGTAAESLGSGTLARLAADPNSLPTEQWDAIRRVYTDALREDMIVCCAVLVAGMLVTLGVYRRNRVSMVEMMHQRSAATTSATTTAKITTFARLLVRPNKLPFRFALASPLTTRAMSAAAMTKRLEGKTVVITGASSGIGRSCAFEFARTAPKNLKLVLTARRVDRLREIATQIREEVGEGVQVLPVELDVSDPEAVKGFVGKLPEEFKAVDVLVNNAGLVKGMARAPEIAEDDINVMFKTNVTGLINMTQAVLPIFKTRPEGGAGDIINVGSIAGREPYAGGSIYCATKAAVRSFSDALRKELIDTRIRVMEVDPGQVETEFSVVRFYGDKSKADAVYAGCDPLTPDDIAEVVVFVAGRRQNVVVADTLIFPSHQAGAGALHRKT
ncbi:hypothetical protein B0J18DRAFT_442677 [Chaetomium sp. MPI-SDFR-AT-0129]|nr:hypothetical protein B0J18DRAFT_442677 [Chaetomium sp. MPI-SDFR-AT-0129]